MMKKCGLNLFCFCIHFGFLRNEQTLCCLRLGGSSLWQSVSSSLKDLTCLPVMSRQNYYSQIQPALQQIPAHSTLEFCL